MIYTLLKGFVIGIATVIPGVSGGTMALVMGIYEKLLNAINSIDKSTVTIFLKALSFKKRSLKNLVVYIKNSELLFLGYIGAGAFGAIIVFSKIISYLLEAYSEPTYGFFLGLIIVSSYYPIKMLKRLSLAGVFFIFLGIATPISLSLSMDSETKIQNTEKKSQLKSSISSNTEKTKSFESWNIFSLGVLFAAGAVAITASILPGVSGSFILLLFGLYFEVMKAIYTADLVIISVFGFGCIIGLFTFSRFFSWLLVKYYDSTVCFLIGLMFGSIYGIWPFQDHKIIMDKRINLGPIIPDASYPNFYLTLITIALGAIVISGLILFGPKVSPVNRDTAKV